MNVKNVAKRILASNNFKIGAREQTFICKNKKE